MVVAPAEEIVMPEFLVDCAAQAIVSLPWYTQTTVKGIRPEAHAATIAILRALFAFGQHPNIEAFDPLVFNEWANDLENQ